MANFDNTVMMALPKVQASLGFSVVRSLWVLNVYTLTAASLVLTGGMVANLYGRKRVFLTGLFIFTIASLICGFAPNSVILIAGRILQGIGAASLIPTSIFILGSARWRQKVLFLALWLGVSVFGLWAGYSWSGNIASILGWRSLFLLNVPVGAIAFWVIANTISPDIFQRRQKLNWAGILLSIVVLSSLACTLRQGIDGVWRSPFTLWLVSVNALSFIAFFAVEYRNNYLIRQLRFIRRKVLASVNFVSALSACTVFSLLIVLNAWLPQVQAQTQSDSESFPIYLLTPASDLVQAGYSNFELVFGRAGSDTIYSDDPPNTRQQNVDVDFLFGDIFDNTPQEYEIILNIQNNQQGGNPLLILERDIPSVGKDRFILGDSDRPYYASADPATLLTTNFLGLNEYAVIYDFDPNQDSIQLNGRPQDYLLIDVNNLRVEGIQQPFFGKAIISLQQGAPDVLGYIIARPKVTLNLNADYFKYVGARPQGRPGRRRKISQLGTTGRDLSLDAATDSAGNVYLTGTTTGPLFGANQGSIDAWLAKYNSSGTQVWARQFGGSSGDSAHAVATDSQGNIYVVGETGSSLFSPKQSQQIDAWVAKYDSNGNRLWGRQFNAGGFVSAAWGLDVDTAGNVYVSGLAVKDNPNREIFDFSVEDDSWVRKFDSNGNQLWSTDINTPFFHECYDVTVDQQGNAYITGWTQGLVRESDPIRPLPKYDVWVVKVNSDGQVQWLQQIGSTDFGLEFAWAIDTDTQGFVYLTGWTTGDIGPRLSQRRRQRGGGSRDVWLFKLNPTDGSQVWAKQFGGPGDDGMILSDMEIDAQDNIFLIGHTDRRSLNQPRQNYSFNAWVGNFDTNGNNRWFREFGSGNNIDYPAGVAVGNNNTLYVTGFTDGLLGNLNGANTSAVDAWLTQLDKNTGRLIRSVSGRPGLQINSVAQTAPPVRDISSELVTAERLPAGDFVIQTTEGIPIANVFSYGRLATSLARIFNPNVQNSFPRAFAEQVRNGNIQL
jgi:MFS family permease